MPDTTALKDEFYKKQSKEQLVVFLHNSDLENISLRERLFLLGGCYDFGGSDGTNGACVECSFRNKPLWDRCNRFSKMHREYIADEMAREKTVAETKKAEWEEF